MKNKYEQIDKIKMILKKHGIVMNVGGCGCCGSPWIYFEYNGKVILSDSDSDSIVKPADDCGFKMKQDNIDDGISL